MIAYSVFDWKAELAPEFGGNLYRLAWRNHEMLRTPPEPESPSDWRSGERIRRKTSGRSIISLHRRRSHRASMGTIRSAVCRI